MRLGEWGGYRVESSPQQGGAVGHAHVQFQQAARKNVALFVCVLLNSTMYLYLLYDYFVHKKEKLVDT